MFKAIKEFFLGKPKTEEAPAQCPYKVETAKQPEPVAVVEDTKVTVTDQITDAVTITNKSDTIPSTVAVSETFPFPSPAPTRKPRTVSKLVEPVAEKKIAPKQATKPTTKPSQKPVPVIKASNSKPRKKK